jgi:phospholipid/cholesterol/gamma-HCH transport system permease protein
MADATESPSLVAVFNDLSKRTILALQDYSLLASQSIVNVFTPPQYWADALDQMDSIGVGSVKIVVLASLFIGGVLVLNTASQFERFGMTSLTGNAVSLALVRELGPTITAILVAGRNASAMASELGSMVVTEQVDAMRALGTDPIRKLMTPRVIATTLMLPLLTAMADFVGLLGGFAVAYFTLGLGLIEFWKRAIDALEFGDIVMGMSKPILFGLLISTIGCYQGLRVSGGTQGVGRATTTAVVVACVSILVTDFFLTRILLFAFKL